MLRVTLLIGLLAVLVAQTACADGGEATADPAADESPFLLPESPIRAALNFAEQKKGGKLTLPSEGDMIVDRDAVEAFWYVSDERYVVYFDGVKAGDLPLCAVTSAAPLGVENAHSTTTGFGFGAAMTAPNTCRSEPPEWVVAGEGNARNCDGKLLALTNIPYEAGSAEFGLGVSLSTGTGPGDYVTIVGKAAENGAAVPVVDLASCEVLP